MDYSLGRPWRPPPDVGLDPGAGTTLLPGSHRWGDVTGPQHDCVLVRYGELALKSRKVRARFTARLKEFIIDIFGEADLDLSLIHI